MILQQLATAGVQQAHKEDRIAFAAVTPWPGEYICADGRYREGDGDDGLGESAPVSSSAPSSARCPVRTWWRPRVRRATPASMS